MDGLFATGSPGHHLSVVASNLHLTTITGKRHLRMTPIGSTEMYGRDVAEDYYLTLPQVAELLHVSARTVFNMTRDGRLPARRLPGTRKYLYVRQEIIELVDQHRADRPDAHSPAEEPTGSGRGQTV